MYKVYYTNELFARPVAHGHLMCATKAVEKARELAKVWQHVALGDPYKPLRCFPAALWLDGKEKHCFDLE